MCSNNNLCLNVYVAERIGNSARWGVFLCSARDVSGWTGIEELRMQMEILYEKVPIIVLTPENRQDWVFLNRLVCEPNNLRMRCMGFEVRK